MLLKFARRRHASFQPLSQEKTYNLAHEQTPLSNDSIDSFLWHREVSRAKDLSASPRIVNLTCIFTFTFLYSVAQKISLGRKNIGEAFVHPPSYENEYAYNYPNLSLFPLSNNPLF